MAFAKISVAFSILLVLSPTVLASAFGYKDAPNPIIQTTDESAKSKVAELLNPPALAFQGLIYCKSGSKLSPLKGALARITCLGVDKDGYEFAPFSALSHPADANGYFLATLYPFQIKDTLKIRECKAFLESSPLQTCNLPIDINKGENGALLSSYRLLSDKNIKLYSVGPLFYAENSG